MGPSLGNPCRVADIHLPYNSTYLANIMAHCMIDSHYSQFPFVFCNRVSLGALLILFMFVTIGEDIERGLIEGKVVPTGAYIVYPFSDVHLDPELYPDPWKFDPGRETAKSAYGYVGWGGGQSNG